MHGYVQVRRLSGEEPWQKHLRLQKCKEHFLWTIESTGLLLLSFILIAWHSAKLTYMSQ